MGEKNKTKEEKKTLKSSTDFCATLISCWYSHVLPTKTDAAVITRNKISVRSRLIKLKYILKWDENKIKLSHKHRSRVFLFSCFMGEFSRMRVKVIFTVWKARGLLARTNRRERAAAPEASRKARLSKPRGLLFSILPAKQMLE